MPAWLIALPIGVEMSTAYDAAETGGQVGGAFGVEDAGLGRMGEVASTAAVSGAASIGRATEGVAIEIGM